MRVTFSIVGGLRKPPKEALEGCGDGGATGPSFPGHASGFVTVSLPFQCGPRVQIAQCASTNCATTSQEEAQLFPGGGVHVHDLAPGAPESGPVQRKTPAVGIEITHRAGMSIFYGQCRTLIMHVGKVLPRAVRDVFQEEVITHGLDLDFMIETIISIPLI